MSMKRLADTNFYVFLNMFFLTAVITNAAILIAVCVYPQLQRAEWVHVEGFMFSMVLNAVMLTALSIKCYFDRKKDKPKKKK